MNRHLGMAVGLLVLAGCSSSNDKLEPGEWELTYAITDVTAAFPPDVIAGMKKAKQTWRRCITAEQAAKPPPDLLLPDDGYSGCKFSNDVIAGGKIAGSMECPGGNFMGKTQMTMQGQYDPRNVNLTARLSVDNAGSTGMSMTVESRTTGRRIGDCPAGKKS